MQKDEPAPHLLISQFHGSQSTQNLEALVHDTSPELAEVLKNPAVLRTYRLGSPPLVRFFTDHIRELLELAFKDDCKKLTICAFKILTMPGNTLIAPLLEIARFGEYALEILSLPPPQLNERLISRLASVTLTVLASEYEDSLSYCNFVFHLLRHCENIGVFGLFCTIASAQALDRVQKWLIEIGFADYVIRELSTAVTNGATVRETALLRLVAETAVNPRIFAAFNDRRVVAALNVDVDSDWMFENARWGAINAICSAENPSANDFGALAVKAHGVITKRTDSIHEYHATCVAFLVKFVGVRNDLFDEELVKAVLGLTLQFRECSLFQLEVRKFVRASFKVDVIRRRVVTHFVHVMIVEAQIREHGSIAWLSRAVLEDIWIASQSNRALHDEVRSVHGYREFVAQKLKPYIALRESDYGGEAQQVSFWDSLLSVRVLF